MASYSFTPHGVCSAKIDFDIEDGKIYNVKFFRGCNGNTKGLAALAEGMKVEEVIKRLRGTDCGGRGTSCPDQLAQAIEKAIEQN